MRLKGVSRRVRGPQGLSHQLIQLKVGLQSLPQTYNKVDITGTELKSLFYPTNHRSLASEYGNEQHRGTALDSHLYLGAVWCIKDIKDIKL